MLKRNRIGFGSPDYLQKVEPELQPSQKQDVATTRKPVPIKEQLIPKQPKRKSKYQRDN